jgi:hypothetical protein
MGTVYGLLGILFALVMGLLILVLKYRSDVAFLKDMFKINNDYVKECEHNWAEAIKLCKDVCETNGHLLELCREDERV